MVSVNQVRLLVLCISLTLLAGCIRSPLKKNIKLKPIKTEKATYENNVDDITVQAHTFSKQECKQLLGTTIKNTDIIQITVTNNTPMAYELKKTTLDTESLSITSVTQRIQNRNKTIKNVGIAGACYIGAVPAALFGMMCVWFLAAAPAHLAVVPLGIAATGVGAGVITGKVVSKKRNKAALDTRHILKKLSPEVLHIAPSTTESMLIFVDSSITPDEFNLSLYPIATQNITHNFTVTL